MVPAHLRSVPLPVRWDIDLVPGWLFLAVLTVASVVITRYLQAVNSEVISARVNRHEGTKGWDWVLVGFLMLGLISILVVAGLDDRRYHWFPVPWCVCGIGYLMLIMGLAGMTWAEAVNKFFEPTVRIQTDRGHHVIDTGPYAIIRHPGYAFAALIILGMPLALGSIGALIPAVFAYLLLILRILLEERTLRSELPGYRQYAERVRYRLIPGVW